jgi:hypothetical protein
MGGMVNDTLDRLWKKAVMISLLQYPDNWLEAQENHETPVS